MTDTTRKIIAMLADDDAETRCAAAMVLARLRPLDDEAVTALREGLRTAPLHARSYFLDALAATEDPRVVPDVIDVLDGRGSVVDMAIGVARRFGATALAEIARRHEGVEGWLNGAYIKAVAGIHRDEAARMLIDRLPATDWDQARATSMFFNEHFERYPEAAKAYVRATLRRYLEEEELELPALITCLNLVRNLREEVDREVLMRIAEEAESPSTRRHAYMAMEALPPDLARLDDHRKRLHRLLDEAEDDDHGRPIVDVLAAWDEPPPGRDELIELASRSGRCARDYAFQELARLHPDEAGPILEAELAAADQDRSRAALAALSGLKDGLERLLRAFAATDDPRLRGRLGQALVEGEVVIDEATLESLRGRFADSVRSARDFDSGLLHLLGSRDREGLNAYLVRRAAALIASGAPEGAIALLQPLVRHRHGNEETRFVLALANLRASRDLRRLDEPYTRRCIDILSPLARTPGHDLAPRLDQADELAPVELLTILVGLTEKGRVERKVARALIGKIDETALEERDRRALTRLREDLEARA